MQFLGQVTFAAHARSKRQGVPAAVYGQLTECHGAEPKENPVVSPGKAPIQAMAGGAHGVRGPALAAWKIWLAPRAALPTLPECKVGRPSADGRNAL